MKPPIPPRQVTETRTPAQRETWFATFTFLDASGAISASQLAHLKASLAKLWRRTIGRLVWTT